MAEQKAIERLKCMKLFMQINDKDNESKFLEEDYGANDMAIKALEKQIPKTPIDKIMYKECPKCGSVDLGRYCMECGQAIKWE